MKVDDVIKRFYEDVLAGDHSRLTATMLEMERYDCWAQAVQRFPEGPATVSEKANALLSFWFTYGLASIPSELKGDLPCLVDAFQRLFPPYAGAAMVLYRGELASRHDDAIYGISWTPDIEAARRFARRRELLGEGPSAVLRVDASPDMIVLAVRDHSSHTLTLQEDEYLLDPRRIAGKIQKVS